MMLDISPIRWAIMMQESGGDANAERYESGFHRLYVAGRGFSEQEQLFRATSWGLFQLMGQVLRERGYSGGATAFCADPALQLSYFNKQWALINKRFPVGKAPRWRRAEAWNKGIGGAARLDDITRYGRGVETWLAQAPKDKNGRVKVRFA